MDEVTLIKVMLESGGGVHQATVSDEVGQLFLVRADKRHLLRDKVLNKLRKTLEGEFEVRWLDLDDSKG